jgi:glycosyltransferase involved in cell wall biosynthesis
MTSPRRPRIGIISFSMIRVDSRVLRQARSLARDYDVTVCGFGESPFDQESPRIAYHQLPSRRWEYFVLYPLQQIALLPGLISPKLLWLVDLVHSHSRAARRFFRREKFDAVICNDTETMLRGFAAREARPGTRIVLDLHEYATRESDPSTMPLRKRIKTAALLLPLRRRLLRHVASRFDGVITVNEVFSRLYEEEFGIKKPVVVWNAPALPADLPEPRPPDGTVHLIHHGGLGLYREPERMINAVGLCGPGYRLHFMFSVGDMELTASLKAAADQYAPGQVEFHPPVKPHEVAATIARFDAGIYILPPKSFNDEHALPNKFFEWIVAGLAVAVAPSVCMADIVREHGLGEVAEDYSAEAMAAALKKFTPQYLEECKAASRKARLTLNAAVEQEKVRALMHEVLSGAGAEQ